MSMLAFMPWCRIDKTYDAGDFTILPFKRHVPIDELDDLGQCRVNTILAAYKSIDGRPVDHAAIVRYASKSLLDDLDDAETAYLQDLVTLACFSGLAKREYFNPLHPYCNSDSFSLCFQQFEKADFAALITRRREGQTWNAVPIDNLSITIPVHCHPIREVTLDEPLLNALVTHRGKTTAAEWARWQNALTCFNQANTDSDNIRHQAIHTARQSLERGQGRRSMDCLR